MRTAFQVLVLVSVFALGGCESIESAWESMPKPDASWLGLDDEPKESACKNALCDGLPEQDCLEIPYCQKP